MKNKKFTDSSTEHTEQNSLFYFRVVRVFRGKNLPRTVPKFGTFTTNFSNGWKNGQDKRDNHLSYEMQVTVQLTDKKTGTVGFAQVIDAPGPITDLDRYAGYTNWEFRIPFGDMKNPKLTACVIEFGFVKQDLFIPISVFCDDVDSAEEIISAGGTELSMKSRGGKHFYWNH